MEAIAVGNLLASERAVRELQLCLTVSQPPIESPPNKYIKCSTSKEFPDQIDIWGLK